MHFAEFTKPIIAIVGAGVTALADISANSITEFPSWISELGLPVAFLICVIYALVSTNRALRSSEAGRLKDKDEFVDVIRDDQKRSSELHMRTIESNAALKVSMEKQAEAFERIHSKLE